MAKKSWNDKLYGSKGLPVIKRVEGDSKMARRFGTGNMLVAAPVEYQEVMMLVPEGMLITSDEIRDYLAKKHEADFTCQLTAGIFINIVANASREREEKGEEPKVPYWRTLKRGGELNEKYPDGIDGQKLKLELEGHEVIKKGKKYYVKDYKNKLFALQ